jgi:hypothetical protein
VTVPSLFAVFVSYNNLHRNCAASIANELESTGYLVWSDWVRIGQRVDWREVVARCLPAMDVLIAVGGSDYRTSQNCWFEWHYARYARVPQFRLEDLILLGNQPWRHSALSGTSADSLQRLVQGLAVQSRVSPSSESRRVCCEVKLPESCV